MDLGVSSYQIDENTRGFSYINDGKLDMRMNQLEGKTASDIVNNYTQSELTKIIYEYGEEKYSRQIAKAICEYRKITNITTTKELVNIIEKAVPAVYKKNGHPAKRTFQAIRIETNNELQPLYKTIVDCVACLNIEGRLCVITFHSLEDRIVKNALLDLVGKCTCPPDLPYCMCNYKAVRRNY